MSQTGYVNNLANAFIDKWDNSRFKRGFGHARSETWFKITITFYLSVG